jgi:kynureninase
MEDSLKDYREKFYIPKRNDKEVRYFAGNSLGLQPKNVKNYIDEELKDWEIMAVNGHFQAKRPWKYYHELLTEETAGVVGAETNEVVNMNSLTVNLNLMMVSFYRPTKERYKILTESKAFPSDIYAITSQIKYHGYDPDDSLIYAEPREGEDNIRTEDITELIEREGDKIALILFAGVNYYTGQAFDIKKITEEGHRKGCIAAFDLAHAAGNIILKLHEWDVDFAIWCSYKYLNAGPGAVGGAFVHNRFSKSFDLPRFTGWWGHRKDTRFLMPAAFEPSEGIEGWQISNPPILQMAALKASLDLFSAAGMERLREKSIKLTGLMEKLINEKKKNSDMKIDIITPSDPEERGCQLSLRTYENGRDIHKRLLDNGIICDWREPDVIRAAPVPMYNTFEDTEEFVRVMFAK